MFITFEGPEGSGKSENARWLAGWLGERGVPVTLTREPGGTPLGERVRALVLDSETPPSPQAALLLFSASRAELVETVLAPALRYDEVVICDRYTDSTLAYQGYGEGLPLEEVQMAIALATGGLQPDLTFLLDLPAEVGLSRRAGTGGWNGMDGRDLAFHQRVREGFLCLARDEPHRWRVIDASMSLSQVREALVLALPEEFRAAARVGSQEEAPR